MLDRQTLRSVLLHTPIMTVYGYHATSSSVARDILRTGRFLLSRNAYDWLGAGVYFWEAAPTRALDWARQPSAQARLGPDIAVIGARIRLERGIDFHDTTWHAPLRAMYEMLRARYEAGERPLPRQTAGGEHGWDHDAINYLVYRIYRRASVRVGFVRASFREPFDEPIFGESALYRGAHVQIAVRDVSLIEDAWLQQS